VTTVLVVDDEPVNRALIRAYLADHGYHLIEAASGQEALEIASQTDVDLVLLDVVMPGIDGMEVTRRLRASSPDGFLPIVLVTALTDQGSRRRGLEAGADEFLSKPVDPQELLLRTRNLLALRDKEKALLERNIELLELRRFRGEMVALVLHDLKNPLAALRTNVSFAKDCWPDAEAVEALADAETSGQQLSDLLTNIAEVQRLEEASLPLRRESVRVAGLLTEVLNGRRTHARQREIVLSLDADPAVELAVDRRLMRRVVENLLDNAFRYVPVGGQIQIAVTAAGEHTQISVGNSGPAVPADACTRIFEKYVRTSKHRQNLGLGLYFCRLAVEAHGGRIGVSGSAELPTNFVIELPST
jgi:two-component system, sensor histidine kinase and response regulator